ncbi:MAG TPA: FMN-binding negative transcriptional regulator [Rhodocyclaceae bacterium]|nr:FMN-binding negative transcriptional regulator [Rhodocyclaceae bacterium]
MYLPRHFEETRTGVLHELIVARPLATLVTLSPRGLEANSVPLRLRHDGSAFGALVGHVAHSNPFWRDFDASVHALAVFHGPQAYVTPSWYATKRETGKVVPTWNYVEVQARGPMRAVDDPVWLREMLCELTAQQESDRADPWSVDDAPRDYVDGLLRAIVGIEIPIVQLSGKWKVSQNQPAANRTGVIAGLAARGDTDSRALADLVARYAPHNAAD